MTLVLLTALLASQPSDQALTAGALYDGCVRHLAAPNTEDMAAVTCDIFAAAQRVVLEIMAAGQDAAGGQDTRIACPPEAIMTGTEARPFIETFVAYVERNPGVRHADASEIFDRALAEKWPCPR